MPSLFCTFAEKYETEMRISRKNSMKQLFAALLLALTFNSQAMAQQRTVKLRVIQTSDVHGSFFPYDFINRKPKAGTLARVSSYVNDLRKTYKDNLILLENGDILQGQPTCYYYNYVNTQATKCGC